MRESGEGRVRESVLKELTKSMDKQTICLFIGFQIQYLNMFKAKISGEYPLANIRKGG